MWSLEHAVLTEHCLERCASRKIDPATILEALKNPDLVQVVNHGRIVASKLIGTKLLRIIVDVDRQPPEVVTAYITSRIQRYWMN